MMKISTKLLKHWAKKHSRGDVSRLTHHTKVSKPTIIKALKHGEANEEIILKISQYYSEKKPAFQKEIEIKALKMFSHGTQKNN